MSSDDPTSQFSPKVPTSSPHDVGISLSGSQSSPFRTVSVAQMQHIDAQAIERFEIPRLLLMEHAGLAIARQVKALSPQPAQPILICSGMGLNGGDGLSAARHLHEWGYPLLVVLSGAANHLIGESAVYGAILQRLGISLRERAGQGAPNVGALESSIDVWMSQCALIVDALLGIGTRSVVREPIAGMIGKINTSGKPVVSADIPSGLDADTGLVQGVAVQATVTVTFGLCKQGCVMREGPRHVGLLVVDPITIPKTLLQEGAA